MSNEQPEVDPVECCPHPKSGYYKVCNNCWLARPWQDNGREFQHKPYPYTCGEHNEKLAVVMATPPATAAVDAAREVITTVLGFNELDDLANLGPENGNRKHVEMEVATVLSRYFPIAEQADWKVIARENSQLFQLKSDEVERLKAWQRDVEEREAAVCPEDVGFDEYIRSLERKLANATTDINAFWLALERSWQIEPRAYFEKEAPENGFGSPLAMAVHWMWKRDTNTVEARANAIKEAIEAAKGERLQENLNNDSDREYTHAIEHVITALESLIQPGVGSGGNDEVSK